jgi:hypothetical protein
LKLLIQNYVAIILWKYRELKKCHSIDPRHSFLHLGVARGIRNSKMKK